MPPTSKIFAILLPTKFPATIPSAPICSAWNVAANSGSEVPIAIMKIPTNISRMLKIFETRMEFLIANSQDHIRTTKLIIRPKKLCIISSFPFDLF